MEKSTATTENDEKRRGDTLGVWIAIGSGIGATFGVVLDEIALGTGFGACLGVVLGVIMPRLSEKASRGRPGR